MNIKAYIKDLKISSKLMLCFGIVVGLLMLVVLFQAYSILKLSDSQKITTHSFADSARVKDISNNLTNVYLVFSDLVINRNFYDFEKNITDIKSRQEADLKFLNDRAITDQEKNKVKAFADSYKEIVSLLQSGYDILKVSDSGISGDIIMFDSGMDSQKDSAEEYLNFIINHYKSEAEDADRYFKSQKNAALVITLVFTITALVLCGFLIILIYGYIVGNIKKDVEFSKKLAEGNFTERLDVDSADEFGKLAGSLNATVDNLESMMRNIQSGMLVLIQAVEEIAAGNQNLAQRTSEQASVVEEIAATIEESTAAYRQNYDNAQETRNLSDKSTEFAKSGGGLVEEAIVLMEKVNSSSKKISDIIDLINGIAFQTNLLALNAAVEAARAGEQGRGFAVVASEVRNLAQRTAGASKEIGTLIQESVSNATAGSEKVNSSGAALKEIIQSSVSVNGMVAEIAESMNEQKSGMDVINNAIADLDTMTQQNAALVEEIASSSEEMQGQATDLGALITHFKIREI